MTYWLIAAQSLSITMVIANRRMQFPIKCFDLPFYGGILGEPYGKAEILIFQMNLYHGFATCPNHMHKGIKQN